jgi:hypothetical protein
MKPMLCHHWFFCLVQTYVSHVSLTSSLDGSSYLSNIHLAALAWDTVYPCDFQALFIFYSSKHMDSFLHTKVNCLNVVFDKKPGDFVADRLLIRYHHYACQLLLLFLRPLIWSKEFITSWLVYPPCLKIFFRWLISMSRLPSPHMVLTRWIRVYSTTCFCDRWQYRLYMKVEGFPVYSMSQRTIQSSALQDM